MLPRRYIEEWKEFAPWPENAQVEQDLIIEKALIQLFSDSFLQQRMAVSIFLFWVIRKYIIILITHGPMEPASL